MSLWNKVKKVGKIVSNPGRELLKDTSVGRRLESTWDVQQLAWKDGLKEIAHNPSRLLTGIDPASTAIWNKIKGTHDRPLVNLYGSPTEDTFQHAGEIGINTKGARDFFKIGDSIAGYFGGSAAMSGLNSAYASTAGSGTTSQGASQVATGSTGGFSLPTTAGGWADLAGDAYGLYSAYKQNRNADKIGKEANPFGKYRDMYGAQLMKLMADPNAFADDPAYKFMRDQGLEAVQRKMAAGGFNGSTNEAMELTKYAEGLASTYRGDELNRLGNFAGASIMPASRASATQAQDAAFDEFSALLASIGYGQNRTSAQTGPTNPLTGITGSGGGRNMGPW